jgi:hypothetical protein
MDVESFPDMKEAEVLDAYGNEEGAEIQCTCGSPTSFDFQLIFLNRQDYDLVAECAGHDRRKHFVGNPLPSCRPRQGRPGWWFGFYHHARLVHDLLWIRFVASEDEVPSGMNDPATPEV